MKYILINITKEKTTINNDYNHNKNKETSASQQEETVKQWTAEILCCQGNMTYASKTHKNDSTKNASGNKGEYLRFTPTKNHSQYIERGRDMRIKIYKLKQLRAQKDSEIKCNFFGVVQRWKQRFSHPWYIKSIIRLETANRRRKNKI